MHCVSVSEYVLRCIVFLFLNVLRCIVFLFLNMCLGALPFGSCLVPATSLAGIRLPWQTQANSVLLVTNLSEEVCSTVDYQLCNISSSQYSSNVCSSY